MQKIKLSFQLLTFLVLVSAASSIAQAQAMRTWVSGVGDDVNPCSRTAPCKTYAGAISKTAAGGEISTLDPGGFGTITITKSITINAMGLPGNQILNPLTNGVIIPTSAVGVVVVLRGIAINGAGTGTNGIRFLGSGELHLENCSISGNTGIGIDFQPNSAAQLFVKDTVVHNNTGGGILVKPTSGVQARASIDGVRVERNTFGIRAEDNSLVTVRDSVAAGNINSGFVAFSNAVATELNLESCVAANNGSVGVVASGQNATVRITNVTATNNNMGLGVFSNGRIISFGNNRIGGNPGGDGTPTLTVMQQ